MCGSSTLGGGAEEELAERSLGSRRPTEEVEDVKLDRSTFAEGTTTPCLS